MNATSEAQTDCPEVAVPVPLFFFIGLMSLAENLLVVLAVLRNRNLHSPMYCFICSLAAFNTIASLSKSWETVMLVFADAGHLKKESELATRLDDVVDSLLCLSFLGSITSFLAIAVDRYITIFHALRYHNIMTKHRARAVVAAIWTLCGLSAILMMRFFYTVFFRILFVVFFTIALVVILFLYIFMFMLARIHANKIAALPRGGGGGGGGGRFRWRYSSMRGALTLTILFGAFMVCWAPFFVHLVILMVCPSNPYCECYRSLFQPHLVLLMSHALIDPVIYAFRSAELRQTFRKMLLC